MSPDKDSSAKKIAPENTLKEQPNEGVEHELGIDQFTYIQPDKVRESIRTRVEQTLGPDIDATAEDAVVDAYQGLNHLLEQAGVEMPKHLLVSGGENDARDLSMSFDLHGVEADVNESEKQKFNLYGVCDDSGHKFNRGAMMVNYDDSFSDLSFFLAQSEQYDQIAANRSNAAAIKAGYEIAVNPDEDCEEIVNKAAKNVELVEDEFGEDHKPMDLTAARLMPTTKENTYKLEFSNLGNNKLLIVDTESGDVRLVDMSEQEQLIEVKTNELILVANEELFKSFETKKEPAHMQIGNRLFMEHQMGKPLKDIIDEIINDAQVKGYDTAMSAILVRVPNKPELKF